MTKFCDDFFSIINKIITVSIALHFIFYRFNPPRRQPDNREATQQGGEEEACMAVLNNFYGDGIKWHDGNFLLFFLFELKFVKWSAFPTEILRIRTLSAKS